MAETKKCPYCSEEILIDAHPHIGSNKLPKVVQSIRETIINCGGEIHFDSRVTDFIIKEDKIAGVDLVKNLCYEASRKTITVGFLGGFGDIAEGVAKRQKLANPNLKVVFAGPGDPTISYDSRLKKQLLAKERAMKHLFHAKP